MKIKHKNLSESFKLLLSLGTNYGGENFTIRFTSSKNNFNQFICSRQGDVYTNCEMADSTHVLCVCDHMGLACGMLYVSITVEYEDSMMPDGTYKVGDIRLVEALDEDGTPFHVELTQGTSDVIGTSEMVWNLLGTVLRGTTGARGVQGKDGVSIVNLSQVTESTEDGGINVWRVLLSNGLTYDLKVRNGVGGSGSSIEIEPILTEGTEIAKINGISIYAPAGGAVEWDDIKPENGIPESDLAEAVRTILGKAGTAIQPEEGKDLSSNDYTDEDKEKLAGIEAGAEKNPTDYVKEAAIADMETKTNAAATYQPKGEYADASHTHTKSQITDFPTIPSTASEISTDEGISEGKNVQADLSQIAQNLGDVSTLETEAENCVGAINELKATLDDIAEDYESASTLIG